MAIVGGQVGAVQEVREPPHETGGARPWFRWLARVAANSEGEQQVRRALFTAGAMVALLGFAGWVRHAGSQQVPDLDASSAAYRTLLLFVLDDNGVIDPPVMLNVARFAAPFVAAVATVALFVTGVRRWLQRHLSRTARDHVVLVGDIARAEPYAASAARGPAGQHPVAVLVDAEPSSAGAGCLHVAASWGDAQWVSASSALRAHLVVLATGADDHTLQALNVLLSAWDDDGPRAVHVELQDRSTATWLSISLARAHPDRSIEVCCFEEGLARQAVAEMVASVDPGAPLPQLAVIGDGALVDLLTIEAADALAMLHRRQGGRRPVLLVADHPRADAIAARFVGLAAHLGVTAVTTLRDVIAGAHGSLLVVVTYADEAKTLRVAAEVVAREASARVFVPERRSFQALGLHSLDPVAAHRSGALDGPFTRAARQFGTARQWPAWDSWSDPERRVVATWLRRTFAALLEPDGVGGGPWAVDQEVGATAPEPLPRGVARALIRSHGALERTEETGIMLVDLRGDERALAAAADAVLDLPSYLFDAADLLVRPRPSS